MISLDTNRSCADPFPRLFSGGYGRWAFSTGHASNVLAGNCQSNARRRLPDVEWPSSTFEESEGERLLWTISDQGVSYWAEAYVSVFTSAVFGIVLRPNPSSPYMYNYLGWMLAVGAFETFICGNCVPIGRRTSKWICRKLLIRNLFGDRMM